MYMRTNEKIKKPILSTWLVMYIGERMLKLKQENPIARTMTWRSKTASIIGFLIRSEEELLSSLYASHLKVSMRRMGKKIREKKSNVTTASNLR